MMKNLIIDAGKDKIFFSIIYNNKSYTTEFINNRKNFDKLVILLFEFLNSKNMKINEISNVFVNQGIGKFSGIRASLAVVKGLGFANNIKIYGYNSHQISDNRFEKIIELFNKGCLKKNLIKPHYSS
jgi:tRNA A37 threonylcarbamoyladenosine modification protein TsaB|tara:strand:- start:941 stop:1321 length:381 start_codon:yes stop_codon:yes gene_type:complete